jgi:hypothetical protein
MFRDEEMSGQSKNQGENELISHIYSLQFITIPVFLTHQSIFLACLLEIKIQNAEAAAMLLSENSFARY